MRHNQRQPNELRPVRISRHYTKHAEGSVLIEMGDTQVLCNASVIKGRPRWMKEQQDQRGWVTAEYGMLPRATGDRNTREATSGKQNGRTLEIQRLISRALRAAVDLHQIGDYTITVDCDVIQADGGTRTAAITGACIALYDALAWMVKHEKVKTNPFQQWIAAVSVGICDGEALLDLDYHEDSQAHTDMNIVRTEKGEFIELQGTAEKGAFSQEQLNNLLALGSQGTDELIAMQKAIIEKELKHLFY